VAEEAETELGGSDPAVVALWDETATSTADPRETIKPRVRPTTLELPTDELQILGELGRGGVGRVMAARQLLLAREVAVKELQKRDASAERWVRFLSEAIVTASLEHPNIVPVHELRQSEDGGFRLVMKKVDGQTWRTLAGTERAEGSFYIDRHLEILLRF
jgi:serine/threonine protein kinase